MSKKLFAAAAAVGVVVGLAAAAPASARVQFAVFDPTPSKNGGVVNFVDDGEGHLKSVTTKTPTIFNFDLTPLADFGNLKSTFDFNATQAGAAGVVGGTIAATFNGSFDFYYSGKTMAMNGITLTQGELLLHGSFNNATFLGRASGSGATLTDDSGVGAVTFTSAIPSGDLPLSAGDNSFALGFIDISPILAIVTKGKYAGDLRHFQTVGDGEFSSGVPEPATWALMLVGFGAVGLAARRRPRPSSTAA